MPKFKKNVPVSKSYTKVEETRSEIFWNNVIGGIGWAIGAAIGGTILIALIGFALKKVNLIPVIGSFVAQIADFVVQNSQHLGK